MNLLALWDPADADRATVIIEFAGAGDRPDEQTIVRAATHDNLLAAIPAGARQAGPVEWRTYGPEEAPAMLLEVGITDDLGLVGWLAENRGTVLVVATVCTVPVA